MKLYKLDLLLELTYMDSWLNWNWFIIGTWMNDIELIPWVKGIELLSGPNWRTIKLDIALLVYLFGKHVKNTLHRKHTCTRFYYKADIHT